MITLELRLDRREFALQEPVNIGLRIANSGAVAVELPDPEKSASTQPTFRLEGPPFPEGKTFSQHSLALEAEHGLPPPSGAPPQIRLEPGGVWEGSVPLGQLVDLGRPGVYKFRSAMRTQTATAESAPVSFTIVPNAATSVHLGTGTRPLGNGEGELAFLQPGSDSKRLLAARFSEGRPDIGELDLEAPLHRMAVGAGAGDVVVPSRNSPFFNEMFRWIVWREGAVVHAVSNASRMPVSVSLHEEPAALVRPALKTTRGPVEVFAVSKDGRQLSLISFDVTAPSAATGKLSWTVPLAKAPAAIAAALAPAAAQSRRHVAFAAQDEGFVRIFHASYAEGGPMSAFRDLRVEAQRLLGGSPLAMFVDENGDAWVGVLAPSRDQTRSCIFIELRFPADGGPAKEATVNALDGLPAEPQRGTLLYVENQGRLQRREAVIAVDGDRLFRMTKTSLVPVSVPGTPTSPILLAPGENFTYILYFAPERGFYFEPL